MGVVYFLFFFKTGWHGLSESLSLPVSFAHWQAFGLASATPKLALNPIFHTLFAVPLQNAILFTAVEPAPR